MKLCFVARDVEEFARYLKGLDCVGVLDRFPREIVSRILEDPLCGDSIGCGIYKTDNDCGLEWASVLATDMTETNRTYVMLNTREVELSKDNVRDNLGSFDERKQGERLTFLGQIEQCMKADGKDEFDDDTFIFIHWGGGDPLWYEEQFQPFCDAHPEKAKGLHAFALSSRRRELFDVTAPKIVLPRTDAEARELVDKFTFDRIKDVMTEYVLNYFSNKEEQKENPPSFTIGDDRLFCPFRFFFNSQVRRLESLGIHLSDIAKRRLSRLKQVRDAFNRNAVMPQIPYAEETVELFTALIRGNGHV